jgi:hypothetical protein
MRTFFLFSFCLIFSLWGKAHPPTLSPIYPYRPYEKELSIDLKNPVYHDDTISTKDGGVIKGQDIRIQAQEISYVHRKVQGHWVHMVKAKGDLMVQYQGRTYVGKELYFDFTTKEGAVYDGVTFLPPFYIGGKTIKIEKNGSYFVENAYLTACENKKSTYQIKAKTVNVQRKKLLQAKNVRFQLYKFPTLWLPSFKLNLKKFPKPIFTYKVTWDKTAGPKLSMRYQLYSWHDWAFFLRGEYRLRKGFGGALETEYYSNDQRTTFVTKSYLASDVIPTNLLKEQRYRLQGEFHTISESGWTAMDLTWDKYSDVLMPGDFKSPDFEINTAKKTELFARHRQDDFVTFLKARPKFNPFDTVKQDLPTLFGHMKPILLFKDACLTDNWTRASYLKQDFSDDLSVHLPGFQSIRLQTNNLLSHKFYTKYFSVTPHVGVLGIFYSDSPNDRDIGFGQITYGVDLESQVSRSFENQIHTIKPYLVFNGLTRPTTPVDDHFIFSILDGSNRLNLLKLGFKQLFIATDQYCHTPYLTIDLFANAFFGPTTFSTFIPKIYLNVDWDLSFLALYFHFAWNYEHTRIDYSNIRLQYTVNEDVAFSTELRYRSKYDWRKADHTNFILDVTRSQEELLNSPISDQRMTLLTKAFFRLTPFWTLQLQSHHGWMRRGENPYNEWRIDLFSMISAFWKIRCTYQHTQRDDRVTFGLELVKK